MAKKTYVIDFDGTIRLKDKDEDIPNIPLIDKINELFNAGNTILINSSAAWQRYAIITKWLEDHEVQHHDLILGRPWGDYYVDDKMMSIKDFIGDD